MNIILPASFLLLFYLFPETPEFLLKQNKMSVSRFYCNWKHENGSKTDQAYRHQSSKSLVCTIWKLYFISIRHMIFQAARKSQKFYHGNEVISHLDETEKLNEVEKSDRKQYNVEGNNDSRLSFSDFSKYVKTLDFLITFF